MALVGSLNRTPALKKSVNDLSNGANNDAFSKNGSMIGEGLFPSEGGQGGDNVSLYLT